MRSVGKNQEILDNVFCAWGLLTIVSGIVPSRSRVCTDGLRSEDGHDFSYKKKMLGNKAVSLFEAEIFFRLERVELAPRT